MWVDPWVSRIPWRKGCQPTLVLVLGESHGQRSLEATVHRFTQRWTQLSNLACMHPPDSSVGKESSCNAKEPSSILGSGRSSGERIGYALQYSWASFVGHLVKNPPTMQETWVQYLGWENSMEKGKATHFSILAWRIPWTVQSIGLPRVRCDFHIYFSLSSSSNR